MEIIAMVQHVNGGTRSYVQKFWEYVSPPKTVIKQEQINELYIDLAVRKNSKKIIETLDKILAEITDQASLDEAIKKGNFKMLQLEGLEEPQALFFTDTRDNGTKTDPVYIIPLGKNSEYQTLKRAILVVRQRIDNIGSRVNNGKTIQESEDELEKLIKKYLAQQNEKKVKDITEDDSRKYREDFLRVLTGNISIEIEHGSLKVKYDKLETDHRKAVGLGSIPAEVKKKGDDQKTQIQNQAQNPNQQQQPVQQESQDQSQDLGSDEKLALQPTQSEPKSQPVNQENNKDLSQNMADGDSQDKPKDNEASSKEINVG